MWFRLCFLSGVAVALAVRLVGQTTTVPTQTQSLPAVTVTAGTAAWHEAVEVDPTDA